MSKDDDIARGGACRRLGCAKEATGVLRLELRVHPHHAAAEADLTEVCDDHGADATFESLVSDDGWEQICRALEGAGKERPLRKFSTLRFVRFEDLVLDS